MPVPVDIVEFKEYLEKKHKEFQQKAEEIKNIRSRDMPPADYRNNLVKQTLYIQAAGEIEVALAGLEKDIKRAEEAFF